MGQAREQSQEILDIRVDILQQYYGLVIYFLVIILVVQQRLRQVQIQIEVELQYHTVSFMNE